tara:strand:+ start:244 stop:579 length:336 start_codon:yes stop_codon:yes gene_type:complete
MKPYFIAYIKEGCGYCDRALDLLAEKQEPYVITNLTNNEELLDDVKRVFGHETTPIVVHVDHESAEISLVGGFTELDNYFLEPEEAPEEEKAEEEVFSEIETEKLPALEHD